jgi:hypothetical protein
MEVAVYIFIGGFALYLIIANAVKMAFREALNEFRNDIIKDLKELKANENINKDENKS